MIITNVAWEERSAFYYKGNVCLCVTLFYSEKKPNINFLH